MKTSQIFGLALLGLASSFSAHAQTPVVGAGAPGATMGTGAPGTIGAPGNVMAPGTATPGVGTAMPGQNTTLGGTVPASATTPIGSSGAMYPNGTPTRNMDGGTQRADQPMGGNPAVTGSQQTRSLNRNRTTNRSTGATRP